MQIAWHQALAAIGLVNLQVENKLPTLRKLYLLEENLISLMKYLASKYLLLDQTYLVTPYWGLFVLPGRKP